MVDQLKEKLREAAWARSGLGWESVSGLIILVIPTEVYLTGSRTNPSTPGRPRQQPTLQRSEDSVTTTPDTSRCSLRWTRSKW